MLADHLNLDFEVVLGHRSAGLTQLAWLWTWQKKRRAGCSNSFQDVAAIIALAHRPASATTALTSCLLSVIGRGAMLSLKMLVAQLIREWSSIGMNDQGGISHLRNFFKNPGDMRSPGRRTSPAERRMAGDQYCGHGQRVFSCQRAFQRAHDG